MSAATVIAQLRAKAGPARIPGMARVGIDVSHALGVNVPDLRAVAKRCGTDHELARALWRTGIHEARILATLVADPQAISDKDMESWAADLSSWDVCDFAADLFGRTTAGIAKIPAWARRSEGYVKRCAFSMRAARRVGEERSGPRVPWLPPRDPPRGRRPPERGQERRVLGASADREAEPSTPCLGDRGSRADPRARGSFRSMDRSRRPPGAREREDPLPAPGLTSLAGAIRSLRDACPTRRPRRARPAYREP
jgi:hypothetical protein